VTEYRVLEAIPDFEQVVDLEMAVWGLPAREAVPVNIMHAMVLNGSVVIGAFEDQHMVGMALAFPVPRGRKWQLWSHMTGVHPDYQRSGIGLELKQMQRTWALEHGYDTIAWTFDPLQRGNANFNLHLLGATAQTYHVDFYGEMQDTINAGLPSDRLEVTWRLRDSRVKRLASGKTADSVSQSLHDAAFLLSLDQFDQPHLELTQPFALPCYLAEVPANLNDLKRANPQAALAWRLALRQGLQEAFTRGYSAVDFVSLGQNRFAYALAAPTAWFLYVLECSDGSLYTGISPTPLERLARHNAGKGAAYTATRRPVRLVAAWRYPARASAMKAEAAFKQHSRAQKLAQIRQKTPYRDAPFVEIAQ
jgi:predicted GNAT superfamily acetyltransferase